MRKIFTIIQLFFIAFCAIFSLLIAFLLFVFHFIFLKTVPDKLIYRYYLTSGAFLVLANIWQFNYLELTRLYRDNLVLLINPVHWLALLHDSLIYFRTNSWDTGLIGCCGVYLLIVGIILVIRSPNKTRVMPMAQFNNLQGYINLGVDLHGNPYTITHKELNQHALVIGTTGSGKTSTLLNLVYNCCEQNLPLIYLDGKGGIKLALKISEICRQFGRTLKVFSMDPEQDIIKLAKYNPLAYGNFTEWKNKIVTLLGEAENKGQEHYATEEQGYINLVCEILNKSKKSIDLEGFLAYLSHPEELQKLANLLSPELAQRLVKAGDTAKNNDIIKTLELFYHSHYGSLFSTTNEVEENIISLQQAILKNEIILFLFDAASFKRDTSLLGKLVINDINSAFSSLGRSGRIAPAFCVFDEFAAYASANMANVLAMQRDNGLHAIIGTQSIHAISQESQQVKRIAVELIANCNTFIIHKINDAHDINLLQETIGKEMKYRMHSVTNTLDHPRVTTTFNPEYILDGAQIRALKPGFGYVCRTMGSLHPRIIKFNYI